MEDEYFRGERVEVSMTSYSLEIPPIELWQPAVHEPPGEQWGSFSLTAPRNVSGDQALELLMHELIGPFSVGYHVSGLHSIPVCFSHKVYRNYSDNFRSEYQSVFGSRYVSLCFRLVCHLYR